MLLDEKINLRKELEEKISVFTKELDRLKKEVSSERHISENLKRENFKKQNDIIAELEEKISSLTKISGDLEKSIVEKRKQMIDKTAELDAAYEAKFKALEKEYNDKVASLHAREKEAACAKIDNDAKSAQLKAKENELNDTAEKIKNENSALDIKREDCIKFVQDEERKISEKVDKTNKECARMNSEASSNHTKYDELVKVCREKLDSISLQEGEVKKILDMKSSLEALELDCKNTEEKNIADREKINMLIVQYKVDKTALEEEKANLNKTKMELEHRSKTLAKAEAIIAEKEKLNG